MPSELARWLAEARRHLAEFAGHAPDEPITVIIRAGDTRCAWTLPAEDSPKSINPAGIALSPLERDIVKCLGLGTLTAKAIASRIGRAYDYGLRMILANLCEREPPVLTSGHAGYRLATAASAEDASPAPYGKAEPFTNGYHEPHLNGRLGS
jgi:hypothetical protein